MSKKIPETKLSLTDTANITANAYIQRSVSGIMISRWILLLLFPVTLSSCAIGVLLFYKDVVAEDIYRSSNSVRNYFTIRSVTYSHCGCSHLVVNNYYKGRKNFTIIYEENNSTTKKVYAYNAVTKKRDTLRYRATENSGYSRPLDSTDRLIYHVIDSLLSFKQKGLRYPPKKKNFAGYTRY